MLTMKMHDEITRQQRELASLIARHAPTAGSHETAISALKLFRYDRESQPIYSVYDPALCIVAQGSKLVMLGPECYHYNPASYLVASVNLPITGQINQAAPQHPYLSLQLNFSTDQIVDIIKAFPSEWGDKEGWGRGLFVSQTSAALLDAVLRLVRLLDTERDIPVLGPLVIREILYRILQDEQGGASIRQFAVAGSHAERIAKVINFINRDFAKPLRIDELAAVASMSQSSLHFHFKEVTAMSPLQYQKQVRLQEARRLLLSDIPEAANAGFQVGYESPSQFSREYARMFGLPPLSDIKRLRESLAY
ncbi:AraC family transcriptional regulator [Paenibacillus xerothermodurans]|uniref:AraC family transcriptional regulator n=1 Tax=Paenibacillus xerothermodurans TaxID=1977292 RepID=A0A2W1NXG3_PAEXE|nr:AraC family transcriptional regulator [Paenibacillus xerothermodurans]PZE19548.1 AraC family transcriptional regulator [Paenibacillus xerothermodurans]